MAETYEQWAEARLKAQPVFDNFDKALQHARERAKRDDICSVFNVPQKRGGGYAVVRVDAYEVAVREGYTKAVDYLMLDEIDDLEEI